MSSIFGIALATHVLVGLVGIIASYAVLTGLLRKKPRFSFLRWSALIAFASYLLSWASGGYYYVLRYGTEVKPVVKEGLYPWAHAIFMESKEHIFLFVPVLAFVMLLILWLLGDRISTDPRLKRALLALAALIVIFGTFITISGIIVSGAAR